MGKNNCRQSITIKSPHAGDIWYKGSTYTITWTSIGISVSTNLKINIFKGSIARANFVEQITCTNATHSKNWTIANSYKTGIYYIRIKTDKGRAHGDSKAFTIGQRKVYAKNLTNKVNPNILRIPKIIKPDLAVTTISLTIRKKQMIKQFNRVYAKLEFKGTIKNVGNGNFIDNLGKSWVYLVLTTMSMDYPEYDFIIHKLKKNKVIRFSRTILYPVKGFIINGVLTFKGVKLRLDIPSDVDVSNNYKQFYWTEVKAFIGKFLGSYQKEATITK